VATTDLFYDPDDSRVRGWCRQGAVAVEMEAAAVLAVGARRGIRVACLLGVSDITEQDGRRRRIDAERYAELGVRLGTTALEALA
jgi:purine-nucleoside phosphorylase